MLSNPHFVPQMGSKLFRKNQNSSERFLILSLTEPKLSASAVNPGSAAQAIPAKQF